MRGLLSVTLFLTGTRPHTEDGSGQIGFTLRKLRHERLGRKQQLCGTGFGVVASPLPAGVGAIRSHSAREIGAGGRAG